MNHGHSGARAKRGDRALSRRIGEALGMIGLLTAAGASAPATIDLPITDGVPTPTQHLRAMPPVGGTPLSPADLQVVSDYVWALGHPAAK